VPVGVEIRIKRMQVCLELDFPLPMTVCYDPAITNMDHVLVWMLTFLNMVKLRLMHEVQNKDVDKLVKRINAIISDTDLLKRVVLMFREQTIRMLQGEGGDKADQGI
jgi:hypothetical protein